MGFIEELRWGAGVADMVMCERKNLLGRGRVSKWWAKGTRFLRIISGRWKCAIALAQEVCGIRVRG